MSPTCSESTGFGFATTMSPGANAGRMLPDSTVSVRYEPVRGRIPTNSSTQHDETSSEVSAARPRKLIAALGAMESRLGGAKLRAPELLRLLVRRRPLRAVEGVRQRRAQVLERVAGPGRERQRQ